MKKAIGKEVVALLPDDYQGDCTLVCNTVADAGLQFSVDIDDLIRVVDQIKRSRQILWARQHQEMIAWLAGGEKPEWVSPVVR